MTTDLQPVATADPKRAEAAKAATDLRGHGQGNGMPVWGHDWCADFVEMVWAQEQWDTSGLDDGAASFQEGYLARHPDAMHDKPQVGDAVVYGYMLGKDGKPDPNRPAPRADHVGIVTDVDEATGTMTVANGNFSGQDGNWVNTSKVVIESGVPTHIGGQNSSGQYITAFISPEAVPLTTAAATNVFVGPDQHPIATANPDTTHAGGAPVVSGSRYTFAGESQSPIARHGDRTADGGTIVDATNEGVWST